MEFKKSSANYPLKFWRPLWDILLCWAVIAAAVSICIWVSWWFYPLALMLIANRLLALSLVCHEGLHGTLSENRQWNDFLGRYICAFPTLISFNRYRRLHLLHHSAIGGKSWDPDRHLYFNFPECPSAFFRSLIWRVVTLKNSLAFMQYYTDLPELMSVLRGSSPIGRIHKSSDWKSFLLFQAVVLGMVLFFHWEFYFILFYLIPVIFVMQPYVILMGGLQHGPARASDVVGGPSRSIEGDFWYIWFFLPLNINYHAEHHRNPGVPHYYLKKFAGELRGDGVRIWSESYLQAVRSLFTR